MSKPCICCGQFTLLTVGEENYPVCYECYDSGNYLDCIDNLNSISPFDLASLLDVDVLFIDDEE